MCWCVGIHCCVRMKEEGEGREAIDDFGRLDSGVVFNVLVANKNAPATSRNHRLFIIRADTLYAQMTTLANFSQPRRALQVLYRNAFATVSHPILPPHVQPSIYRRYCESPPSCCKDLALLFASRNSESVSPTSSNEISFRPASLARIDAGVRSWRANLCGCQVSVSDRKHPRRRCSAQLTSARFVHHHPPACPERPLVLSVLPPSNADRARV